MAASSQSPASQPPRARRGLSAARRLWWLPAIAAAAASAAVDARVEPPDLPFFVDASRTLFSGDWADTFAPADLQAGPLLIAALGVGARLAGALGLPELAVISFVVQLGAVAGIMGMTGRLLRERPNRRAAQLAAGVAAVVVGLAHGAYAEGHPAQVAIPLLWVLAAVYAREGRELRGGMLVGLSAGLELWGILGIPVLLLGRLRRGVAAALAAAAILAGLLAPFAAAGDFRMFEYRWLVTEGTVATLFLESGTPFPWSLRLLQAAAAVAAGAAVAWRLRHGVHAVWAAPLAVVVIRVALDPSLNGWYLQGIQTLAILGAAAVLTSEELRLLWHRRRTSRAAPPGAQAE